MGKLVKDLKSAAERFNVPEESLRIDTAMEQVRGIKATMQERVQVYLETLAAVEVIPGYDTDPLLKAFRAGKLPAYVLADYMEENAVDGRKVRRLRTMFD